MYQQLVTIKFANSKLEMLANRLWKSGEPHDLDYVYGRIWLHSLELAHYFGRSSAEEYLRGLNLKYSSRQSFSVPIKVSFFLSDDDDDRYGDGGDDDESLYREINVNAITDNKRSLNTSNDNVEYFGLSFSKSSNKDGDVVLRCNNSDGSKKDEVMETFLNNARLRFSKPGSLKGDRIMSLVKVPLDRYAQDKNLLALYQSIQSDRVRLLWLDSSEDDKILPGLPPLRSPPLFYIPPAEDHLRSLPGPLRRQRKKRWRLSKSLTHSRSVYIEQAKQQLIKQRNKSLARRFRENKTQHNLTVDNILNPNSKQDDNHQNSTNHSNNSNKGEDEMGGASTPDINKNACIPLLQVGGAIKMASHRVVTKDKVKSSLSDAQLNRTLEMKTDFRFEAAYSIKSEQLDNPKENKETYSTSYQTNRLDPTNSSKTSIPASTPNFNPNYFSPKVQPMPYFLFYPTKPQPMVLQPSPPWIVRTPARPMLARMMPTQVILPSFRPVSIPRPGAVRIQQSTLKCPSQSLSYTSKTSTEPLAGAYNVAKFQAPVKHSNGYYTASRSVASVKADQGTQTDSNEDIHGQKLFTQKPQKSDLKVSVVHFPSSPIQANLGFPMGVPHFRNFGMNCIPFVQVAHLGNHN